MKGIKPTSYLNNMIIYTKPFSQQGGVGCPHLCPLGGGLRLFLTVSLAAHSSKSLVPVHQGGAHPPLSLSGPCVLSIVLETLLLATASEVFPSCSPSV